jgi:hypothetical protein
MASASRPHIQAVRSLKPRVKPSREAALRKIAAIVEDQMTEMGLTEAEKNAKVAHFASLVDADVTEKMRLRAKPSKQRQTAGSLV